MWEGLGVGGGGVGGGRGGEVSGDRQTVGACRNDAVR